LDPIQTLFLLALAGRWLQYFTPALQAGSGSTPLYEQSLLRILPTWADDGSAAESPAFIISYRCVRVLCAWQGAWWATAHGRKPLLVSTVHVSDCR